MQDDKLTTRNIQKLQSEMSDLGYFSLGKETVGLLERNSGTFASKDESLADYMAHGGPAQHGYLMKPFVQPDEFPRLAREYEAKLRTQNSETYNWNDKFRVMLQFFKVGHKPRMIPADLVTADSLKDLFAEEEQ